MYPFKLMLMTRDPGIAVWAEGSGVDRIFVDLEVMGKAERQAGRSTIISYHTLEDVKAVRGVLETAELLVRVNPMYQGSPGEIDAVIEAGADVVMLPMFTTPQEVAEFTHCVRQRAKTCLLLETAAAAVRVEQILAVPGIDEVHVGLNDLHISTGLTFMYELLAGGVVDYLSARIRDCSPGILFGFGGGARIASQHPVKPADVLREHVRLGSHMIILSRTFVGRTESLAELRKDTDLPSEIQAIRQVLSLAAERTADEMEADRIRVRDAIWQATAAMRR